MMQAGLRLHLASQPNASHAISFPARRDLRRGNFGQFL